VIAELPGPQSPEAETAVAAFRHAASGLPGRLRACASGRDLIERGFSADVDIAGALGVSRSVPVLSRAAFLAWPS
jgi:2-phosphosulfolactate phosphatase